jgi:hypothetical protein
MGFSEFTILRLRFGIFLLSHGIFASPVRNGRFCDAVRLVGAPHLALVPLELDLNFPFGVNRLTQMRLEGRIAALAQANRRRTCLYDTKVSLLHAGISNSSEVDATRTTPAAT